MHCSESGEISTEPPGPGARVRAALLDHRYSPTCFVLSRIVSLIDPDDGVPPSSVESLGFTHLGLDDAAVYVFATTQAQREQP